MINKYVLPGSVTLLIVSIILLSFVKEDPSYIGIASTVSNINKTDVEKGPVISGYGKRIIPEIAPIVIINQDIPKATSNAENKEPVKKEVIKKKKKKRAIIISPVKEEIALAEKDTFVAPTLSERDTLSSKIANNQTQQPDQKKKKKKKFLFF
ncbi:MAG TPA: hypothetical protein VNW99_11040 [Cytophagaceae bacterium]|jgi:hypothetical protein|nr:hypothetical protein [Cytophagaceae bacterium]